MAGPVADVAERGIKSFMNTMKEVGTEKAVSEALMGGAAGVGLNMAYNVASGDSGGYMGAGLLGGAAGGLGRAGLKHFNLETQASNLVSTFKGGAVNTYSKAQKAVQAGGNNSPKGQILRHGKDEFSTPQYQASIDADRREAASYMKSGDVVKSEEITARANAKNIRRKELEARRHKSLGTNTKTPKTKNWVSPEDKERYINAPEAVKKTKDRAAAKAKKQRQAAKDQAYQNKKGLQQISGMGQSDVPMIGYNPGMEPSAIPMGYAGAPKKDYKDVTQHSKFENSFGVKGMDPRYQKPVMNPRDYDTGQFSMNLGTAGQGKAPSVSSRNSAQESFDFSQQNAFDFDAPAAKRVITGADMKKSKKKNRKRNKNS